MEKIAFLFAGQGAQFVGMGQELHQESEPARRVFEEADRILGLSLSEVCFKGPATTLTQTAWCQPGIYVHSMAALAAARAVRPDLAPAATAGLSLGEFTALAAASWMSFEEGLRMVRRRGELMQEACDRTHGSMASIMGMDGTVLRPICEEAGVDIANLNCPGQVVISGEKSAVERAIVLAKERGAKRAIPLTVAGAYHSRLMKPAAELFNQHLETFTPQPSTIAVFSNVTALPHDPSLVRQRLVEQVTSPVRWEESVTGLISQGIRTFIEFGPGEVLAGLLKRIDREARVFTIGKPADLSKLADL